MKYVDLPEATELLRCEELVVIPTETVYGLAGIATSEKAIQKIFVYKDRPSDNPLICHFDSVEQIREYVTEIPVAIATLLHGLTPGPLTVLLPVSDKRLEAATRSQPVVGCRIPDSQVSLELIRAVGVPLAAPSANPSGKPSSTTPQMAFDYFANLPGGIVASQQSRIGLESTIIEYRDHAIRVLREGSVGPDEILSLLQDVPVIYPTHFNHTIPGSKYRHYAPDTPLEPIADLLDLKSSNQSALITTKQEYPNIVSNQKVLFVAQTNDPAEISRNLYQTLIELDKLGVAKAYWYVPNLETDSSIGKALQNRLSKIFET